jgi:hypothetical protein
MIRRKDVTIRNTRMSADSNAPLRPRVRGSMPRLSASICPFAVCSLIEANSVWVMTSSRYNAPNTAAATITRSEMNAATPA